MPATERRTHDADLLAACRRGDGQAWETLVRRYRRLVYSIPMAYRFGSDAADDVFQRVWIKLVENLETLRDPQGLAAWLATTARRECWAHSKERSRVRGFEDGEAEAMPEDPPDVPAALDAVEREHALQLAFDQLGEPCRGLLHALYVEDPTPSYDELSKRLGKPIGSLGPTRGRCLAKLRKLYEERGGAALDWEDDAQPRDPREVSAAGRERPVARRGSAGGPAGRKKDTHG